MYKPPKKTFWTGRTDGKEVFRVHHVIKMGDFTAKTSSSPAFALLSFAIDEGVKRNQGRKGAAEGPKAFRKAFANIPVHDKDFSLTDFGDIVCKANLEKAEDLFQEKLKKLWKLGFTPFSIGGGHEMSYPHFMALVETFPNYNIGIINCDAHLDLRPPLKGHLSTSGSSFFQIYHALKKCRKPFHYLSLGAIPWANTSDLWHTLKAFKGKSILAEEIVLNPKKAQKKLVTFLKEVDAVYFTLCLDVFSAPFAPGVSAPSPLGISPYDALTLMRIISNSGKMLSFDIAELNPLLDIDGRTAKLAALLAMELLSYKKGFHETERD